MLIEHQMKMHELYANLYMTKAITGEYKKRVGNVTRGDGYVLTEKDLLEDTIQTACIHIQHFIKCADVLSEQLEKSSIQNKDINTHELKKIQEGWYFKYKEDK
jgi:hypothetical protein